MLLGLLDFSFFNIVHFDYLRPCALILYKNKIIELLLLNFVLMIRIKTLLKIENIFNIIGRLNFSSSHILYFIKLVKYKNKF